MRMSFGGGGGGRGSLLSYSTRYRETQRERERETWKAWNQIYIDLLYLSSSLSPFTYAKPLKIHGDGWRIQVKTNRPIDARRSKRAGKVSRDAANAPVKYVSIGEQIALHWRCVYARREPIRKDGSKRPTPDGSIFNVGVCVCLYVHFLQSDVTISSGGERQNWAIPDTKKQEKW